MAHPPLDAFFAHASQVSPQRFVADLPARLLHEAIRRPLTPREHDIVVLVIAGFSNRQIARRLGVALATVKRHIANVMRKWDCHNRTQVAVLALAVTSSTTTSKPDSPATEMPHSGEPD